MSHLIEYVWTCKHNSARREKIGVLLGMKCPDSGEVVIGWSKYNVGYENMPFNRTFGLEIAYNRANCGRLMYAVDDVPYRMQNQFERFVERCKKYYKVDSVINVLE